MKQHSAAPLLPFLLQVSRPFWGYLTAQMVVNVIWAMDFSLRPYLIKNILNQAALINTSEDAMHSLTQFSLAFVVVSLLVTLLFRLYGWILIQIKPPLKKHITTHLLDRMLGHGQNVYQQQFTGNLAKKINDVAEGGATVIHLLIDQFFSSLLALTIAIYAVWQVDLRFAIIMSIWAACLLLLSVCLASKAKVVSDQAAEMKSKVVGYMVDLLSNVMSVRLFATKQYEKQYLDSSLEQSVITEQKRDRFFNMMNLVQGVLFVPFQGTCLWLLITGLKDGHVTVGDFAMIMMINVAIIDNLWNLSRYIIQFSESLGNASQGLRVVSLPYEIEDRSDAKELLVARGEVVFDNVTFRYAEAKLLFNNKSVSIAAGQKVGLVGYSGSGKSTFVNLILRIFDVRAGRILIDGQDIQDVTQDSLRRSIAMIPQDPSLFHRSLMNNIRYGNVYATDEEVIKAAKQAHAHEFITLLPQGYETRVGERGTKLSGGQRQRIAIARAVLKNAPILILDEATSQLDSITENNIQQSLQELMQSKTTIVVAHRLSTLLQMDRILVFDGGKIVEDGNHAQLLMRSGLYKTLWQSQSSGFLPEQKQIKEEK